ncbi:thiol-disulfide oxidoreductase DCC family protein [Risungbinella massiliensis]|uniref:thiol-disulfide oxidoreductase DCC family protein n=1 Tax=Risungbinella massiliensis TaxID=1329796 RepID=UPI0005CBFF4C|nr:DCC1-like thiol-disulfide oxidoreductase family protein [Risungbinella massiliensis]
MKTHLADSKDHAVILFDGVCNFCNQSVLFLIRHDSKGWFRFASLQSETARSLLQKEPHLLQVDSIVLIEQEKIYTESTAILRICKQMDGWWKILYPFIFIPKMIRDPLYRWFARNRYRFFGKKESCMIPTPEIRERFLND